MRQPSYTVFWQTIPYRNSILYWGEYKYFQTADILSHKNVTVNRTAVKWPIPRYE